MDVGNKADDVGAAGGGSVVQRRVAERVDSHQVVVERCEERADELDATEHAGHVQRVEAQLVRAHADSRSPLQERARQSDTPALVGDQRAAHEGRATVGGTVARVHVGTELDKNLHLRQHIITATHCACTCSWRGVVDIVGRRMNEVTLRRARLVLGWVAVFGRDGT